MTKKKLSAAGVAIVACLALASRAEAQNDRRDWSQELADSLRRLSDAYSEAQGARAEARAARASAQSWARAAEVICQPAPNGRPGFGQLIGEMALRLGIHRHTPATVSVQVVARRDGEDVVYQFVCQWTTSVMGTNCVTEFSARVRESGFQGVALLRDTSGKWGQQNMQRVTAFMQDALWGVMNGMRQPLSMAQAQIVGNARVPLFQVGFGSLQPYQAVALPCRDAQGNAVIVFVYFWETGTLKVNQNTIVRWRAGGGVEVDSTKSPDNQSGMDAYCRDLLGPAFR